MTKLFSDVARVNRGYFSKPCKPFADFETRQQRRKRVAEKRRKEFSDSFNSVGIGCHEQQGWLK